MSQTTKTPNSAIVYYLMEISWFGRTVKYRLRSLSDTRRREFACALRASISADCGFVGAAPGLDLLEKRRQPAKVLF